MTRTLISLLLTVAALGPGAAHAGLYGDDLSRCLVKSTAAQERNSLVRWLFAMATLHPSVRSMSSVSDEQRQSASKDTALLFQRLLTQTCRAETLQAVKFEGQTVIASSFQLLGQVAGQELFSDPNVKAGMAELQKYVDPQKFEELAKESR